MKGSVVSMLPLLLALILTACSGEKEKRERTVADSLKPAMGEYNSAATREPSDDELSSFEPRLGGIQAGMDAAAVTRILGKPDSTSHVPDEREPDSMLDIIFYPKMEILMGSTNYAGGVAITKSGIATSRGLAVGDSLSKVMRLYGAPSDSDHTIWWYRSPRDEERSNAFIIRSNGRTVTQIFSGHIYD